MEEDNKLYGIAEETLKFGIVGVSGIGVNFLTIAIGLNFLNMTDELALALGIFVSMSTNYLLNRIWTFQSDQDKISEYPKYILSNLLGVSLQYLVALLLENFFETLGVITLKLLFIEVPTIYVASLAGILLGFVANFVLSKYFVFTAQ